MDGQNHLGIYISSQDATVVCVDPPGSKVVGCFRVSTREADEGGPSGVMGLAKLIAKGCAERNLQFSDVFVALDCEMFLQHTVRSEFVDPKQIASTVRFDTEEAIAADIAEVALAFRIVAQDEHGSKLTVFTAKQKIISEIIAALQSNNMDPVSVEPDISCLSRFILRDGAPQAGTMLAMLSRKNGYFLIPRLSEQRNTSAVRTFVIGHNRNRGDLLAREIPITTALFASVDPITGVKVLDSLDTVAVDGLEGRLNCQTVSFEFPENAGQFVQEQGEVADSIELAIACGAALYHLENEQSVNFRNDFMPYQGGKVLLEKTVQFLGIAAAGLAIVLGLFATMRLFQENKPGKQLRRKFAEDYTKVMMVSKMPSSFAVANKNLQNTERRLKKLKSGLTSGDESLPAKLTIVLDSLNKCAKQTNLKIEKITLTDRSISIRGDTSSRRNTLALFEALKRNNLEIAESYYNPGDNGREIFSIKVAAQEKL